MMLHCDTFLVMSKQQVKRPSARELDGKIQSAIAIVAAGDKFFFANDVASMAEIRSEGHDLDTVQADILACLKEIKSSDYAGGKPPQKSYESKIKECDLFALRGTALI